MSRWILRDFRFVKTQNRGPVRQHLSVLFRQVGHHIERLDPISVNPLGDLASPVSFQPNVQRDVLQFIRKESLEFPKVGYRLGVVVKKGQVEIW